MNDEIDRMIALSQYVPIELIPVHITERKEPMYFEDVEIIENDG